METSYLLVSITLEVMETNNLLVSITLEMMETGNLMVSITLNTTNQISQILFREADNTCTSS